MQAHKEYRRIDRTRSKSAKLETARRKQVRQWKRASK
jgi:hypothetical protein